MRAAITDSIMFIVAGAEPVPKADLARARGERAEEQGESDYDFNFFADAWDTITGKVVQSDCESDAELQEEKDVNGDDDAAEKQGDVIKMTSRARRLALSCCRMSAMAISLSGTTPIRLIGTARFRLDSDGSLL